MISRRRLIGLSALAALGAGFAATRWLRSKPEHFVVEVLERHLAGIQVDPKHFLTFAQEYVLRIGGYSGRLKQFSFAHFPLHHAAQQGLLGADNGFRRSRDNIVSLFLLSTDFFQKGAAVDGTVEYVGFHDPLTAPCRNPFMRFV